MSGHSKWSTIKRQKGATDAARGNLFTKLSNAITIAVREGGNGDVNSNFKLRLAVEKAKAANMPKENVQRAIDRGLGKGEGAALETAIFEGFGPGNVAVMVETITDNTTRTSSELRNVFEKNGGRLAGPGAVSYMFSRVGEIEVGKRDDVFDKAVEAGAQDVEENLTAGTFSVYTKVEDLHRVKESLVTAGLPVLNAELVYRPNKETMVNIDDPGEKQQVESFMETLGELDDVQEVYANFF